MKKIFTASAATFLALAIAVPAFAGGAACASRKASATTASNQEACVGGKSKSAAWAGAWLQRSESGTITVAGVAKRSPAARSGLKAGDVVLAVNGYDLSDSEAREKCASSAQCNVGSNVTYTVQRGRSTKDIKVKLEQMPAYATDSFASRQGKFDPALAAVVITEVN